MIGWPVSGFVPSYTTYKSQLGNGVNGHHGLRLLAGQVDALLGSHLELLLAVPVDVEQRVVGVVVERSSPA